MAKRKTVLVSELVARTNRYLRATDLNALHGTPQYSAEQWQHMRLGFCISLEDTLHMTGNYRGYSYVTDYRSDESSRHYNA